MKNTKFCQNLLSVFDNKAKAIVNLIVALAANTGAKSVTELSLNPVYKYQYSSISDAIDAIFKPVNNNADSMELLSERLKFDKKIRSVFKDFLPPLWKGKYRLLNNDVTPIVRPYSPTIKDRGFVHISNNVIQNNKPISIGVNLSTIGLCAAENGTSWNLPVSMLKVPIDMRPNELAAKQLMAIVQDDELFANEKIITTSDSAYCNPKFTLPTYELDNLVNIVRIAGHRNVFHQFTGEQKSGRGRRKEYGDVFKLNNPKTHSTPDETAEFEVVLKRKKRKCKVVARRYNDMLIRGTRKHKTSDKPFDLIAFDVYDLQTGEKIFKRTLWLTVWGQNRRELSIEDIYEAFRLRFDIEFFFRFGKQNLLLDSYQTSDICHQENWFEIVKLAYWLLYLSRDQGENQIRKWEKYLPQYNNQDVKELDIKQIKTPTQTQRAMSGIISDFAKKHLIPKTRNNKSGRKKGQKQKPKERFKVVKKGKRRKKQNTS